MIKKKRKKIGERIRKIWVKSDKIKAAKRKVNWGNSSGYKTITKEKKETMKW